MLAHLPGFYTLIHKPTGSVYFGSSGNIRKRIDHHAWRVRNGGHENANIRALGNNWDEFTISVSYMPDKEAAKKWEKRMIDIFGKMPKCLNIAPDPFNPIAGNARRGDAEYMKGIRKLANSPEAIAKMAKTKHKKVLLDGVEYESLSAASKALGLHISTIRWGLSRQTGKYANWQYVVKT